jgi:flagellar L-ring protein precursor FlgH
MSRCLKLSLLLLSVSSLTTGCSVQGSAARMNDPMYAPKYPNVSAPDTATTGSLFATGTYTSLFDDAVARRVGDILTVMLNENTSSSKSASTSISKDSEANLAEPTLFGRLIQGKGNTGGNLTKIGGDSDFNGSADSDQENSLQGSITVTIAEVLPNGSFIVRGEKWMKLNQGDEYLRVSGMVRPVDINSSNQVDSTRLANARITYGGTGAVANSNKPGWLSRFFVNPLFPI